MPRPFAYARNIAIADSPWHSAMVCVPIAIVPIALGALENRAIDAAFVDGDSYDGIQLIRRAQVEMILGCESVDRLYRLLDTSLNGAEYSAATVDGQIVVTPAIPDAPAVATRSIHSRLERLEYLSDNFMNAGIYSPDFENPISIRQQLTDLTTAIQETGQLDDDMVAKLAEILLVLA